MLKIELVWRDLLWRAIEKKDPYFTISELAGKFNLSTSLVSHALFPLRNLGIVKINKTKSLVTDTERLLFFWATRRNLQKDIIYQTQSKLSVQEIEASMPADVFPTAYSAFRMYFSDPVPADYGAVYFYSKDFSAIEKRFEKSQKGTTNIFSSLEPNLFIIKQDIFLAKYKKTPLGQIFVDLWNLPQWYAKEFSEAVLLKIKERIGL